MFRESMRRDIPNVFLNPDEFGETHTVNGKEDVTVILDDFELMNREKFKKEVTNDGTSMRRGILYVKASDIGRLPAAGKQITVDDKRFLVEQAVNEAGIYAITVKAVRQ